MAAEFGRLNTVEELLDWNVDIDSGLKEGLETPLHMAASGGHLAVMKKLLLRNANPEAFSTGNGPVICSVISSGNRECIDLLIERGVSLTMEENDDIYCPLELAAMNTDVAVLDDLNQRHSHQLRPDEYSKALVAAAYTGRLDMVEKLMEVQAVLGFGHPREYLQEAFEDASRESKWDVVSSLLKRCRDLKCEKAFNAKAFNAAAGSRGQQDKMLEKIWQYTKGTVDPAIVNQSLYEAADLEKISTCKLLLEKYGANANATGDE